MAVEIKNSLTPATSPNQVLDERQKANLRRVKRRSIIMEYSPFSFEGTKHAMFIRWSQGPAASQDTPRRLAARAYTNTLYAEIEKRIANAERVTQDTKSPAHQSSPEQKRVAQLRRWVNGIEARAERDLVKIAEEDALVTRYRQRNHIPIDNAPKPSIDPEEGAQSIFTADEMSRLVALKRDAGVQKYELRRQFFAKWLYEHERISK